MGGVCENDAKRRKHHAVDQQEDIPHGVLANGVVIALPRPRCKRETLSPQEIKPSHMPTSQGYPQGESPFKRGQAFRWNFMEAAVHAESPWGEYARRVDDASS